MKTDRYTKVMLAIIAIALLWLCFQFTWGKPIKVGPRDHFGAGNVQAVEVVNPVEISGGEIDVSNTVDVSGSVDVSGNVGIDGPIDINGPTPVTVTGEVEVIGSPGGYPVSVEIER
jgi:hypothetical protein